MKRPSLAGFNAPIDTWVEIFGCERLTEALLESLTHRVHIIEANGPRMPGVDESEKHFKLALIILTDHELSDAEWDFYNRSMDFTAAAESRDVLDSFPEETYPEYYHLLSALLDRFGDLSYVDRGPEQVLLNFYMATGGRGTIEFVQIQSGDTRRIKGVRLL